MTFAMEVEVEVEVAGGGREGRSINHGGSGEPSGELAPNLGEYSLGGA